jgi:hypothetical protein
MLRFSRLMRVFFLLGFLAVDSAASSRAADIAPAAEWSAMIDAAAGKFIPPVENDVALRRRELTDAAARLRRALAQVSVEDRASWESYLQLETVDEALLRTDAEQRHMLEFVRQTLTGDIEGLEADEIVTLRTAVKNYLAALKRSSPDLEKQYQAQLEELRAAIRLLPNEDREAGKRRIAAALTWIDEAGQAPELVATMRRHWAHPNAVIRINTEFVSQYIGRDINETSMQRANVLGTQTRGPSQTFGKLELVSIDNPNQAQVMLRMNGSTRSASNVGTNGPAVIYSSSSSQFDAYKALYFDPFKGLAASPTDTRCNASIGIRRIDVEPPMFGAILKPVITRAAWSRAKEQQGAAEKEVARLISRRIEQRLDEEMVEPLKKAQDYYKHYLIERPLRFDEVPMVGSRSTTKHIDLLIKQARSSQLAAAAPPPEFDSATQLGLAIHQSVFNNGSARVVWGGAEVTDEDVEHYSQVAAMHVPPALRVFSNSVPWSVTVDLDHPTTMIFEKSAVDLSIHTVGWKIGEKTFERKIDLRVKYAVENTRLGMTFTRIGDYSITPLDTRDWTAEEREILLPHIHEKCAAFMQEQGRFNSLILPKGDGFGPLGNINLKQLECRDGWMVIGYQ